MGRGKVEMKRIEGKVRRQVSFSKRRSGMMKKAHELAVLCQVDVAVFVFSPKGRLYEFSTDERVSGSHYALLHRNENILSMTGILTRYQSFKKKGQLTLGAIQEKVASEHRDVCNGDELTAIIHRQLIEENIKMLDAIGLDQLEQDLDTALQHIRIRKTQLQMEIVKSMQEKTQLKMEIVKSMQEKNMQLKKENDSIMQEIKAARINGKSDDSSDAEQPELPVMVTW